MGLHLDKRIRMADTRYNFKDFKPKAWSRIPEAGLLKPESKYLIEQNTTVITNTFGCFYLYF